MEYQEFVRVIQGELNRQLKGGVKVDLYKAVKNNGKKKEGLIIHTPGANVSPTIYLEEFYEEFEKGRELEELIKEILGFYEKVKCITCRDVAELEDYGNIRSRIAMKLVNREKNKELMKLVPHREFLDLALVFYVLLGITEDGSTTMQVYNEHLSRWGICEREIWEDAKKNAMALLPAQLFTMRGILEADKDTEAQDKYCGDLLGGKSMERDSMYVLSNTMQNLGAACIAYPGVLEMIGDILEEDYYILPSSIHEIVIVPASESLTPEEMDKMVAEINEAHVLEEEVLSNHAYFYKYEEKKLQDCSLQSLGIMLG